MVKPRTLLVIWLELPVVLVGAGCQGLSFLITLSVFCITFSMVVEAQFCLIICVVQSDRPPTQHFHIFE